MKSQGRTPRILWVALFGLTVACASDNTTDQDTGPDGGGPDATFDAGSDQRMANDAETDAETEADTVVPPVRPNFLFIMLDDAGSADYGDAPYTDATIEQPNMKRLAQQGMRFEQYYSAPMCTPTRMSLL